MIGWKFQEEAVVNCGNEVAVEFAGKGFEGRETGPEDVRGVGLRKVRKHFWNITRLHNAVMIPPSVVEVAPPAETLVRY